MCFSTFFGRLLDWLQRCRNRGQREHSPFLPLWKRARMPFSSNGLTFVFFFKYFKIEQFSYSMINFYYAFSSATSLKTPFWLKSSISIKLLLLVRSVKGVVIKRVWHGAPIEESCPLVLICFWHAWLAHWLSGWLAIRQLKILSLSE